MTEPLREISIHAHKADSIECLEKWLQYESAVLSDEPLRKECEVMTHSLCHHAVSSGSAGPLETIACALHCLLSGGCLPADYLSALLLTISEWENEGVRPAYSESSPTPSSLLELYHTVSSALRQMGHPLVGMLTLGINPPLLHRT